MTTLLIEKIIMVPMRDGVRLVLATDVYRLFNPGVKETADGLNALARGANAGGNRAILPAE